MTITYIKRLTGAENHLVEIDTTDNTETATAPNYILNQLANITSVNNGVWTWQPGDFIFLIASDGDSIQQISSNFNSLNPIGSGVVQFSMALTAAQIDGMYAAPILVLPAPAAGTLNVLQSAVLNEVYGGVVFAGGGSIQLQYKNTADGAGVAASSSISAAALIAATANTSFILSTPSSIVSANAVGQAIYLSNQTAPFTGGTGSTFTLDVLYRNIAAS